MNQKPTHLGQWLLIAAGFAVAIILLVLPLLIIAFKAFDQGAAAVLNNLQDSDMVSAIKLTLLATAIAVPLNTVFGVMLAWCVTRYNFRGRGLLITLMDIPFAMSPIVAGLCYLIVYSLEGAIGGWLAEHGIQLMFAWPGVVMVTVFITCPYVARVLIPLMESQGADEEQAALVLGASGWQIFWRVTLPNIRWGLLYGVILTNARAVGEFGAVSVVSGIIRGQTLTLPLHVELLHQDYNSVGAFTAAGLLAIFAMLTLVAKTLLEWRLAKKSEP